MGKKNRKIKTLCAKVPEFLEDDEHNIDWKGYIVKSNKYRYILIKRLGHGSYSSVWLAYRLTNFKTARSVNNFFAIKIHNTTDVNAGETELNVGKRLYESGVKNVMLPVDKFILVRKYEDKVLKHIGIVMKLMACSTYDLINKTDYAKTNGLPVDFVISTLKCCLESLEKLHSNDMIHSDIKPENILVNGTTKSLDELTSKILKKDTHLSLMKFINKIDPEINTSSDESSESESESDDESLENESADSAVDIESSDSDDDDDDDESDSNSGKNESRKSDKLEIDPKFIQKPETFITDMGTCIMDNKKRRKYIQTRYYRSPEVILRLGYTNKADIWAMGCTVYEMLTGEIFIDPDEGLAEKRIKQLEIIMQKLGPFSKDMINKSIYKSLYFTNDGRLRGIKELKYDNTWEKLLINIINKLKSESKPLNEDPEVVKKYNKLIEEKAYQLVEILLSMLEYDTYKRKNANDLLKSPVFKLQ